MINYQKKFVFIHIPKTGGSSIFDFFKNKSLKGNDGHIDFININNARYFKHYFKFAFHRNPWDRMVSLWKYWTKTRKDVELVTIFPECESFHGFCYNLSTIFYQFLPSYEIHHITNQTELNGHSKYFKVDFWGRFSNLNEDFKTICDHINIEYQPLPHLNRTVHKNYTEYYNDDLRKYVGRLFEKDIDTFKYTFDN